MQKTGQAAEGSLAVLVLRQVVVGLDPLHPDAGFDLVDAVRESHVIVVGEQIAHRGQIAAGVRAGGADLRSAVQSRAAANHHRADGLAGYPSRQIHRVCPVKK